MRALGLGVALVMAAGAVGAEPLTVEDAWIALAPPGSAAHAGYMTATNGGEAVVSVVGAAADGYAMVHLHESRESGGIATMVAVDQLDVGAGATMTMEPGGLHLMLMRPDVPLEEGAVVPITLTFGDGATQVIEAEVRKRDGAGHNH